MTSRGRTTVFASTCLLISMAASILLLRHIDEIRPKTLIDDALYFNSPTFVKRASLGFNGLMACIYWTRTVQYFGHRHFLKAQTFNELAPLLEITTALDPHLLPAYEFGASFLAPPPPNGAGEPARAVELMQYGIEHNPEDSHIYYDLGFVYYTELKDYKRAGEIFARGSKVPGAHPFMKILAAQMEEHAGDLSTARMLWNVTYQTSTAADIRRNALEHLRCIQVDEDITNLQAAVTRFEQNNGRLPTSLWEIISAEHLQGIPVDPDGNPYLMTVTGQIEIAKPDDFPFATKGLPEGYHRTGLPKFHTAE